MGSWGFLAKARCASMYLVIVGHFVRDEKMQFAKRLQLLLDYNIYLVLFFLTPNLCWIPELRIVCLCHPVVFHLLNSMIGGSSFGCQGQTCGLSSNGYIGRMLYARQVNQDHHECICSYLFS